MASPSILDGVMILSLKHLLSLFAVLAVMCAQVFGVQLGYECFHQGGIAIVVAEHCHSLECSGTTAFSPCGSGEKCCLEKGTGCHTPLTVDFEAATQMLKPMAGPAFSAVLVAELVLHERAQSEALAEQGNIRFDQDATHESPSAALQVARCTVILI